MLFNLSTKQILVAGVLSLAAFLTACDSGAYQQEYLEHAQKLYAEGEGAAAKRQLEKLFQLNPVHEEGLYLMGLLHERAQQYRQAFEYFKKAAESDSGHLNAHLKLAEYFLVAKDWDSVAGHTTAALEIESDNIEAMSFQAALFAERNADDQAISLAQKVLLRQPGHVRATMVLARIYAEDNPQLALQTISDSISQQSKNESLKLVKIRLLLGQNRKTEALTIFEELISDYPEKYLYKKQYLNIFLDDNKNLSGSVLSAAENKIIKMLDENPSDPHLQKWIVEFTAQYRGIDDAEKILLEFLRDDAFNNSMRDELARLYIRSGRPEKAKALFLDVVESAMPADAWTDKEKTQVLYARNRLAVLALSQSDLALARQYVDQVLSIDEKNFEALLTHARLHIEQEHSDQAIDNLSHLLQMKPDSVLVSMLLADQYMRIENFQMALKNYLNVLALQPNNLLATLGSAKALVQTDQLSRAQTLLLQARGFYPDNTDIAAYLVDIYSQQKQWSQAFSIADELLSEDGNQAVGATLKAQIYLRKKEFEQAIEQFIFSLDLEPNNPEALSTLVATYMAQQQLGDAVNFLSKYSREHAENIYAQELLANLYEQLGSYEDAKEILVGIVKHQPANMTVYLTLARLHNMGGDWDKAERLYSEALAERPDNKALRLQLAQLYQQQQKFDLAIAAYEKLLTLAPDSPLVKNNLAAILAENEMSEEELARVQMLVAGFKSSENPAFLDTAGWVEYRAGNYQSAVSLLERALDMGGQGADYFYHLGMSYYQLGEAKLAKKNLQLALQTASSDFTKADKAAELLARLKANK